MPRSASSLVLAALLAASGPCGAAAAPRISGVPYRSVAPRGELRPEEKHAIALFKEARDSVVYITTLVVQQDIFTLNLLEQPRGTGSGFVWDDSGHVVTNFHVIQGADAARVTLADGSKWEAKLVGASPDKDLAVLRIEAPRAVLKPLPIGGSHDLQVGQSVYAIGNPFGLDQSLTTGVISALGREIHSLTRRPIQGVIQTDAAINPGNSGGPLLDSGGRLIGVNTQIYSPSGAYAGVGFAVPADIVNQVVPQLIRFGKVIRPGFGVSLAEDGVVSRWGLAGVLVLGVEPGGAAARAGLRPTRRDRYGNIELGDVVVALDGKPVRSNDDLYKLLEDRQVGDAVTLTVNRERRETRLKLVLQELR